MRRVLSALVLLAISIDVYAIELPSLYDETRECTPVTIQDGIKALQNTTYEIEYAPNMTDRDGNPLEGFMKLTFKNLPDGYEAYVTTHDTRSINLRNPNYTVAIEGGVYTIEYHSTSCTGVIKAINIKVPFYKTFCGVNVDCKDDPWWDGTYENSASNQNRDVKIKVNTALIIVLVILLLIIGGFVAMIIKRRKDRDKTL